MIRLSSRERLISSFVILSLGLWILDRFVGLPITHKMQQLDHAVLGERSELAHDRRLLADRENIKRSYAVIAPAAREEEKSGPSSDIMTTLKEVESLARRCGVKINTIKPQSASGRSGENSAVFLSMESSWDPLMQFIAQIQRSPQLLQIEKVNLQSKGEEGSLITGQLVICELVS
jgi:hypothetical protein